MLKVIGFDFDGTLAQSNALKRQMFFRVAGRFGDVDELVTRALAAAKADRHTAFQSVVDDLAALGKLPAHPEGKDWAPELVKEYTLLTEEAIVACPEVPGAMDALSALRSQGYSLFVNSATPLNPLCRILGRRKLSAFLNNVYGHEGSKVGNILQALTEAGCEADQVLFVGDNEADRAAAEEVGCHFAGIENEFSSYRKRPLRLIADMSEVMDVVAAINQKQMNLTGRS